jgi:hypothetical protein
MTEEAKLIPPKDLYLGAFSCFDEARRILEVIPDPSKEVSLPKTV